MRIVVVSGGFDPLHIGHLKYFEAAKKLGDTLVVGINSDEWLTRKKGNFFQSWEDRSAIIRQLRMVDQVYAFNDRDDTALDLLYTVRKLFPTDQLIIANGGDRTPLNNAEAPFSLCDSNHIFVYGVGGIRKENSSSLILKRWKELP